MCGWLDYCINFSQLLHGAYFVLVCKCLSVIIITITVFATYDDESYVTMDNVCQNLVPILTRDFIAWLH